MKNQYIRIMVTQEQKDFIQKTAKKEISKFSDPKQLYR